MVEVLRQRRRNILVVRATTRQFNPLISQAFIDEQIELDPDTNRAEYLSEWRQDIAAFVTREVLEASVIPGRYELVPRRDVYYMGFVDAAGGSGADSMTLAVAHYEGYSAERRVLDLIKGSIILSILHRSVRRRGFTRNFCHC
jgi:hypothetical protein